MRRIPLLMVITSVLAGLGIIQMVFLIGQGAYRAVNWSSETQRIRLENVRLSEDIAVLESVRDRAVLPEYLAELARCQGFVGAGERVVVDEQASVTEAENCERVALP